MIVRLLVMLLIVLTLALRGMPAMIGHSPRARLPRGTYATEGRDPTCVLTYAHVRG